ncbi:hypothetical protein [Flavobacterium aciduliphilum]|uniref:Uncharacterized protein n=1 Tax=Flavobacterium aciduliphilum TaxID=1101402 RepID=A0A328YDA6_9FLAO|nr:hypothetical protein [Flavobacterium aciduliphilum]RAR71500.1 hypothetical protein CLV55_10756 [Flavobacterium aciduliphilum]
MGLFDFFKSPEQRKQQEQINQLRKQIFPGGRQQQEQEIQEVRQLLNFKYSKEATEYAYCYAVISYFTSNFTNGNELTDIILRNSECTVSREDATKIAQFAVLKRHYNSTTSLGQTLHQKSDGEKLFMVAFGGIVEIKRAYKDLTNFGKFEVLLFNSLIALQEYQSNYPEKYEAMQEDFFRNLFKQARVYNIPMTNEALANFVNSRFETYIEEIIRFFDPEEEGYMLLKTYTLFYEQPLEPNPEISFDLFEYAAFLPALMQMRTYVIEKTFTTI